MPLEVDHAFIACALEAPEADALLRLGFVARGQAIHIPAKVRQIPRKRAASGLDAHAYGIESTCGRICQ
jgi:hypothetical protein